MRTTRPLVALANGARALASARQPWVEEQTETEKRIKDLLPQDSIREYTRMVLLKRDLLPR